MPFRPSFPITVRPLARTVWVPALVFVIAFSCGHALVQINHASHMRERDLSTQQLINARASAIERTLSFALVSTYILAQEVIRSGGEVVDFDGYAASVLEQFPDVSNLQLAPDGIIRHVYPLAGNERAIGHDLVHDDARRKHALAAIASRKLTLAGPFPLLQGGVGMIGRNPIFLEEDGEERFWGFASALILMDSLLERTDIVSLSDSGHAYELSRTNPETDRIEVFAASEEAVPAHALSIDVQVPNGTWHLRAAALGHHSLLMEAIGHGQALNLLLAIFLALFSVRIVREPEKLRRQVAEQTVALEKLAYRDFLTGLPNRLKFTSRMNATLERARPGHPRLHLMLMDIDHFKPVNDTLGHDVGDRMLVEAARRMSERLPDGAVLYRLGGDEFTVILDKSRSRAEVEAVAASLVETMGVPFRFEGLEEEVRVSTSIGIVGCHQTEASTRDMLKAADAAMYEAKRLGRARFAWYEVTGSRTSDRY